MCHSLRILHLLHHHHDNVLHKISGSLYVGSMVDKFDELAFDEHNYPT
jgi:hypothetical protein